MRHRFRSLAAAVAAVVALSIVGGSVGVQSASAGPTTLPRWAAADLVPQLGDVTVNQGVGSYVTQKLARGKETLVRFFLKLPPAVGTTCSGSINVTSAALTLINGPPAADLSPRIAAYQSYGTSGLQISSSSVSVNSQADPIFVVPASRVTPCDAAPCTTTGGFSRNFKATISYPRTTGGVTSTPSTGPITLPSTVTASFDQPTNDLRVLVIPMGDASLTYSSHFGPAPEQPAAK